jgi:hypothetical protein
MVNDVITLVQVLSIGLVALLHFGYGVNAKTFKSAIVSCHSFDTPTGFVYTTKLSTMYLQRRSLNKIIKTACNNEKTYRADVQATMTRGQTSAVKMTEAQRAALASLQVKRE